MTCRIQTLKKGRALVFRVSGQLDAESVRELGGMLEAEENKNRIVLDLKEVALVDRATVRVLGYYEAQGVMLEHCPAYIREWILRETAQK